jgi:phosphate transport system substrate-binding protein
VQGVEGDRGSLGYFGLSYYEANKAKLKLLKVDNGKGCVAPSVKTVQNGTYKPLARPLFIYAKRSSFNRAAVRSFIGYIFNNERAIAKRAAYVPLTEKQLRKAGDSTAARCRGSVHQNVTTRSRDISPSGIREAEDWLR